MRKTTGTLRRAGAIAVTAATAAVVLAAGGSLDPGYGTGGVSSVSVGGGMNASAVQADGLLVACGQGPTGRYNEFGNSIGEWQIRRFGANGGLDASFGTGGLVRLLGDTTSVDGSAQNRANDVAMDANGRTVAVGQSVIKTVTKGKGGKLITWTGYATVARLTASGGLDSTFGTGGVVRTLVPGARHAHAWSIAIQPDGRVVVGGVAYDSPLSLSHPWVARYLANGSLDTTFGTGGITVETRVPPAAGTTGFCSLKAIALQSTGHVVAAWRRAPPLSWIITRLTPGGAPDTGFTPITSSDEIAGITVDRFDRIVATGKTPTVASSHDGLVVRYTAGGSLDASFGAGGAVTLNGYMRDWPIRSVVFQPADDAVVVGVMAGPVGPRALVAATVRLTDAGALDASYGSNGWSTALDLGFETYPRDVELASGGGVLLAGETSAPTWFVASYTQN